MRPPKAPSIFRGHRSAPAETIVDAGFHRVFVIPEAGADDLGGAAGEVSRTEIVVLVFGLSGPVWREHVFQACADGVAILVICVGGECHRNAAYADADVVVIAEGITALGVQQRRPPG